MTARNILMAAAGGSTDANYIEDVFSTWLYAGNGSTQTITNGIDLAGKGGLVWAKSRSAAAQHVLADTVRGTGQILQTSTTNGNTATALNITSFNADGYGISSFSGSNGSGITYASWTFREAPKFFDVVTYTGNGAARTIAHNLGSVPGCIIVKQTSASSNWMVYHRGLTSAQYVLNLNNTGPQSAQTSVWNSTNPTSTVFSVGADLAVNDTGQTYVAYLFAHNAGGFGLTGTDNVISCGSFNGPSQTVTLGWEPQWLLIKRIDGGTDNWILVDTMRGFSNDFELRLFPNLSNVESLGDIATPTATGFVTGSGGIFSSNYIYIAIRRGPMKVPTDGTKVFAPVLYTGDGTSPRVIPSGFPVDFSFSAIRNAVQNKFYSASRLSGNPYTLTSTDAAEVANTAVFPTDAFAQQSGVAINNSLNYGGNWIDYFLRRAPGYFDEVCYTGTGAAMTVAHNLAAVPEMMIVKSRSLARDWFVYVQPVGATNRLRLNDNGQTASTTAWNSTAPTASVFSLGTPTEVNGSGTTYIARLFATCPGVSKVGSYTGTGATQVINCGFTTGARFILIKSTSGTGDWYVWDSARGIVAGNDPYLLLNLTDAEVTNTDWVDTAATGFELSGAGGFVNTNGVSYIFLAIA